MGKNLEYLRLSSFPQREIGVVESWRLDAGVLGQRRVKISTGNDYRRGKCFWAQDPKCEHTPFRRAWLFTVVL
jgi:hypothetical protein